MIEIKVDDNTYTEEEFQRDLHRYFKTLNAIASYPCKTFEDCKKCMFLKYNLCGKSYVNAKPTKNSFEIIEKVYKWAKEHPVKTNRDKLKEVFGGDVLHMFLKSNYRYGEDIKRFEFDTEFENWLNAEYKESEEK